MPLAKLSFSAYVISRKRSANQPKKLQNKVFPVKTSLPKISLILQKMKIGQKSDIRPFCRKAFNYISRSKEQPWLSSIVSALSYPSMRVSIKDCHPATSSCISSSFIQCAQGIHPLSRRKQTEIAFI